MTNTEIDRVIDELLDNETAQLYAPFAREFVAVSLGLSRGDVITEGEQIDDDALDLIAAARAAAAEGIPFHTWALTSGD